MCVVVIAVNARVIAAIDFQLNSISDDDKSCGRFCRGFYHFWTLLQKNHGQNRKSAIKIFYFSKKYGIIVQSNK